MANLLKSCLIDLNCNRALVAKIQNSINLKKDKQFSVLVEYLKDADSIKSIVKNIPYSVLELEFKEGKDKIIIASQSYDIPDACKNHLQNINAHTIVNQLLYIDDFIWGVLSFQFNSIPPFISNPETLDIYNKIFRYYKKSLLHNSYETF